MSRCRPLLMPGLEISWLVATPRPPLSHDEVHVWAVALNPPPEKISVLVARLSREEQDRAQKFRFDQHRHRFIVGRGALRALLAGYVEVEPALLEFAYSARGKPSLTRGASEIHFNLAHSDELALIAITRLGAVGVDVERVRPMPDGERIAERFFSAGELNSFRTVPAALRDAAFFNLWTRKEAWLKATGDGIAESLSKIEVAFLPDEAPRVRSIAGDAAAGAAWKLCALNPAEGFVGALAIQSPGARLSCRRVQI